MEGFVYTTSHKASSDLRFDLGDPKSWFDFNFRNNIADDFEDYKLVPYLSVYGFVCDDEIDAKS